MKNKNIFPLEDIKAGYLLVVKDKKSNAKFNMTVLNGKNYMTPVDNNIQLACVSLDGAYYWPLYKFNSNLEYIDIIIEKVYGCTINSQLLKCSTDNRTLLWERKEPKKMTVQEVCDALGYDVEIVKG